MTDHMTGHVTCVRMLCRYPTGRAVHSHTGCDLGLLAWQHGQM